MRTTVTIPDNLAREAQELSEDRPLSELIRAALQERVDRLKAERLAQALDDGYRSEAQDPSIDPAWTETETEGL